GPQTGEPLGVLEPDRPADLEQAGQDEDEPGHAMTSIGRWGRPRGCARRGVVPVRAYHRMRGAAPRATPPGHCVLSRPPIRGPGDRCTPAPSPPAGRTAARGTPATPPAAGRRRRPGPAVRASD